MELEAGHSLPLACAWQPWLGVELGVVFGSLRVRGPLYPDRPADPATSLRLAARPLVFDVQRVQLSFAEVSAGLGLEAPGRSISVAVTPVAVGARF